MDKTTPLVLDIGTVIKKSLAVFRRNWLSFVILTAIFSVVPAVFFGWYNLNSPPPDDLLSIIRGAPAENFVTFMLTLPLTVAVTHGVLQDLRGRRTGLGDQFGANAAQALPVLGIMIVTGIAMALGLLLLVVPGIILACMWIGAVPAQLAEKKGVGGSMTRSGELSKGSRMRIAGLILGYVIVWFVAYFLVTMLLTFLLELAAPGQSAVITGLVSDPIAFSLFSVFGIVGSAVTYVELRRIKEGAFGDELATVFD